MQQRPTCLHALDSGVATQISSAPAEHVDALREATIASGLAGMHSRQLTLLAPPVPSAQRLEAASRHARPPDAQDAGVQRQPGGEPMKRHAAPLQRHPAKEAWPGGHTKLIVSEVNMRKILASSAAAGRPLTEAQQVAAQELGLLRAQAKEQPAQTKARRVSFASDSLPDVQSDSVADAVASHLLEKGSHALPAVSKARRPASPPPACHADDERLPPTCHSAPDGGS